MAPFDRYTSSYWRSIVTMVFTISEINRNIGWKSRFFHTLLASGFDAPVTGSSRSIAITFGTKKTRMVWLWWIKFDDTFSRFGTIPACDTVRRTNILRQQTHRAVKFYRNNNKSTHCRAQHTRPGLATFARWRCQSFVVFFGRAVWIWAQFVPKFSDITPLPSPICSENLITSSAPRF